MTMSSISTNIRVIGEELGPNIGWQEHNKDRIASDACGKRYYGMVLNHNGDHVDDKAYYKRGQWSKNGVSKNFDV